MIEYIVILVILVFFSIQDYLNRKERKRLIEAIMAKSLTELKQVEAKPAKETKDVMSEFVPVSEVDNEEFDKAIKKQLGRETIADKVKEKLGKAIHGR